MVDVPRTQRKFGRGRTLLDFATALAKPGPHFVEAHQNLVKPSPSLIEGGRTRSWSKSKVDQAQPRFGRAQRNFGRAQRNRVEATAALPEPLAPSGRAQPQIRFDLARSEWSAATIRWSTLCEVWSNPGPSWDPGPTSAEANPKLVEHSPNV